MHRGVTSLRNPRVPRHKCVSRGQLSRSVRGEWYIDCTFEYRRRLASDTDPRCETTAALLRFLFGRGTTGPTLSSAVASALEQGSRDLPGTPALATWMFFAACLVALFPHVPASLTRQPWKHVATTLVGAGAWGLFWHAWPAFLHGIDSVLPVQHQVVATLLLLAATAVFIVSLLHTGGTRLGVRCTASAPATGATNGFSSARYVCV